MPRLKLMFLLAISSLILLGCFGQSERDETGKLVSEGSLDVFAIRVGDCTNDEIDSDANESEELIDVAAIPCDQPHDNEFYFSFDIVDETYPGDEAIIAFADETCLDQFQPFVGASYEESIFDYSYIYPTLESWAQNDREVLCFLYDLEFEKLQGSMADTKL